LIILIVGLGSIAKKHIAAILELIPQAEIYALRSNKHAEIYPNVTNISHRDELNVQPDFIIVSNPTKDHEAAILESLGSNCPIFIEKPVLSDLDNVSYLKEQIAVRKTMTYVACNLRFHPVIEFLKDYLERSCPRINEVNIYCGSFLPEWRPDRNYLRTYSANVSMGGGVHLDLIHEIDYCTWLFGKPFSVNSVKRNVSSLGIDAIDFANYQLFYERFTVGINLNYYRKDSKRYIEIVTEDYTLTADLLTGNVTKNFPQEILFVNPLQIRDTYIQQMKYFIDHMIAKQPPMNDFNEAVEVLKLALV